MNKIRLTFLLLCIGSLFVFAESKKKDLQLPPDVDTAVLQKMFGSLIGKTPQCEIEFSRDDFDKQLQVFADSIDKGEFAGKPLTNQALLSFISVISNWPKMYKYFELDTNISTKSINHLGKILKEVVKASMAMDAAEKKKNTKAFDQCKKIYNDNADAFIKGIKKLEKPDRKMMEQVRLQKVKEHRLYMQYLRSLKKDEDI